MCGWVLLGLFVLYPVAAAVLRVTFWGLLAMGGTALLGKLVGASL